MQSNGESPIRFPTLPILNQPPAEPPLSQREKYGGLFYLGIGGLAVVVGLLAWFGHGVYARRSELRDVYILYDTGRPEQERIAAAIRVAHSPGLEDAQRFEMSLDRTLPDVARLALAEGVTIELAAADPRAFGLAVAKSEGWPSWLRLALAVNVARGVARGYSIPRESLNDLSQNPDPMIAVIGLFCRAAVYPPDETARKALDDQAERPDAVGQLAARMRKALDARPHERDPLIDEVARFIRSAHEPTAKVWADWKSPGAG